MRLRPALIAILLLAGLFAASAEERCTGTLCDLYYGGPPTDPEKPAPQAPARTQAAANGQLPEGATPVIVPRFFAPRPKNADGTPAAADPTPSRFNVQGGGLVGLMNGEPQERCTGTICDLYYGGPPPEKAATPPAGTQAALAPAGPEPGEPPAQMEERETVHRAPPSCAAKGRDPWSCYR